MSAPAADAGVVPAAPRVEVGLWRERWFRVVTVANCSVIAASALTGLALLLGVPIAIAGGFLFAFPVVPIAVMAPPLWLIVLLVAAALCIPSLMFETQKGVRYVRAMTVAGAIVLWTPVVVATIGAVISAFSALVSAIAGLW